MPVPHGQTGVAGLPLAQVSCFSGFPHHGLDPFAHITVLPSLPLDFGSSAQCLTVDLCICFHQLLVESSMLAIKVVFNLITGEGQFRRPLHCCLES